MPGGVEPGSLAGPANGPSCQEHGASNCAFPPASVGDRQQTVSPGAACESETCFLVALIFTTLAGIIQPSSPVSRDKSPQNQGYLSSCARRPGGAKLRRVRRKRLILFAGVLITAGRSLCAEQGTTLSDTEALRLRAARPGAVVQLPEFLKQRAALPPVPANIAPDAGRSF